MQKKYIVRLSKRERELLVEVVKKLRGTSQKVDRAQVLLKADAAQTVEGIRRPICRNGIRGNVGGEAAGRRPHSSLGDRTPTEFAKFLGPGAPGPKTLFL